MIAIGNGEKCPYCDIVMTEATNTLEHMSENHKAKFLDALFGDTDKEYQAKLDQILEHKQKGE